MGPEFWEWVEWAKKQPLDPFIYAAIKDLDPAAYYNHFYSKEMKMIRDKRKVKLEEMLKEDYIPLGSGRPERDLCINHDDTLNLQIALNTTGDVLEFIKAV